MNCPNCDEVMTGMEYLWSHPDHYDGVSEWYCSECRTRVGRWTLHILKNGETEPRYGLKEARSERRHGHRKIQAPE